ncbi:MAG: hypothetical protein ACRBCJ_06705 [Hyphomicrobiaceae bacterium]
MYKKTLAVVALGLLCLFLYFMGRQVEEAGALIFVLFLTACMAAYDFWRDAFKSNGKTTDKPGK